VIRFVLALSLLLPAAASAAVHAERLPDGEAILVDGRFDEAAWARAPVVDEFVGVRPTEGFEPAGATSVRVLYDDKKLYFAWTCAFDEPTRVRAYLSDREAINRDDQVAIQLDPYGDGRRAYHLWMNPLGVQQDILVTLDGEYSFAWDTVFHSVGRVTDTGFVVEVAVPFRSLRFDPSSERPWRVLFKRKFPARDEYIAHPAIHRDEGNELLQYADLLMDPPKTSGVGVELMPGVVGRTGWDRLDPADGGLTHRPFEFPGTVDPSFGFKWLPAPSVTVDATVNPDFSQIEADPDQVDNNLRFALFLEEQRPFFLEGTEYFDRHLLYTRSIRDPIYGVKVSGKKEGVGVGVLHALDESPAPSFVGERVTPGFSAEAMAGAMAFNTLGGASSTSGDAAACPSPTRTRRWSARTTTGASITPPCTAPRTRSSCGASTTRPRSTSRWACPTPGRRTASGSPARGFSGASPGARGSTPTACGARWSPPTTAPRWGSSPPRTGPASAAGRGGGWSRAPGPSRGST